ncbi:MAG: DUF4352 domain-containing protein [Desulfurococcales archaeon]|nr:DUF4352 domain-containing protein [Desulfurococcales archaeon]
MKRVNAGIEPVIALVIIVAVAIAISIAVAGWLMGLWGTFGGTEQLQVLPTTNLENSTTGWILTVNVKNTGSKDAVITKIELVGVGATGQTGVTTNETLPFTVPQGQTESIQVTFAASNFANAVTPGAQYVVKVYTDSGGVYQGYVVAQS